MPHPAELRDDPTPILLYFLREAAPEKHVILDNWLREVPPSLAIDRETHHYALRAFVGDRQVVIGLRPMARLWARAYAYRHLLDLLLEAATRGSSEIEIEADHPAVKLLDWSIKYELNNVLDVLDDAAEPVEFNPTQAFNLLPTGAPVPFSGDSDDPLLMRANVLWKHAMCFLAHHEYSHIRNGHTATTWPDGIEEEKTADREAAGVMLEDLDEMSAAFLDRACGVAVAMLWLTATEIHTGPIPDEGHPPGYDRLYQVLNQYILNERHPVWGLCAVVLKVHYLVSTGREVNSRSFASAKDEVSYFADLVSRIWVEEARRGLAGPEV